MTATGKSKLVILTQYVRDCKSRRLLEAKQKAEAFNLHLEHLEQGAVIMARLALNLTKSSRMAYSRSLEWSL